MCDSALITLGGLASAWRTVSAPKIVCTIYSNLRVTPTSQKYGPSLSRVMIHLPGWGRAYPRQATQIKLKSRLGGRINTRPNIGITESAHQSTGTNARDAPRTWKRQHGSGRSQAREAACCLTPSLRNVQERQTYRAREEMGGRLESRGGRRTLAAGGCGGRRMRALLGKFTKNHPTVNLM